ncbi:MAG: ABC transporter ATP-binding protein [Lachnospiraceae bacterium]|nr:ABC transporter ATP-binding protein [Lachnospiraceae bacterium]
MSELLEVKNLSVSFFTPQGEVHAVRDVSFSLKHGEVLAIVGESGCGKSALCKSILKLLPDSARIKSGRILVNGTDITDYRERDMCRLRGKLFSMVFQDPMAALNPTMSVEAQIAEAVKVHQPDITPTQLRQRVTELMTLVGIESPQERMKLYPCNFSGGMRQRSVMAIALAGNPAILFADEPTTALDVTIQAQILDLLREVQEKTGTATVFVTHDLGVVARVADRVAVMYAGKIVEIGTVEEIFYDPRHPYTWGLMRALPACAKGKDTLYTIPGMPPTLLKVPRGDAFACRNEYALGIDYEEEPPMFRVTDTHYAATWLMDERAPGIKAPIGDMR